MTENNNNEDDTDYNNFHEPLTTASTKYSSKRIQEWAAEQAGNANESEVGPRPKCLTSSAINLKESKKRFQNGHRNGDEIQETPENRGRSQSFSKINNARVSANPDTERN